MTPFQRCRGSPPEDDHVPLNIVKPAANGDSRIPSGDLDTDQLRAHNSYDSCSTSTFTFSTLYSDSSESISSFETFLSTDNQLLEQSSTQYPVRDYQLPNPQVNPILWGISVHSTRALSKGSPTGFVTKFPFMFSLIFGSLSHKT
jgi:hypothetical protein